MIKLHVFHTGLVRVDRALPFGEGNPLASIGLFRSADKKIDIPVSAYLVEHPKGRILIDTGWNSKYATEKLTRFAGFFDHINHPIIKADEGIETHLQNLGLSAADLDCVYLSHLDCDHTSGIDKIKDAKHFMSADIELAFANKNPIRYMRSDWANIKLETFSYDNTDIGPVGRSYDVFNDGSVVFVNTPGHAAGLFCAIIKGEEKFVVLASDAIYSQRHLSEHILPGIVDDKAMAEKTIQWLRELHADKNCLGIYPNHDPSITERVVEL